MVVEVRESEVTASEAPSAEPPMNGQGVRSQR